MKFRFYKTTGRVAILEIPDGFATPQLVDNMRDTVRKDLAEGTNKLIVDLGRCSYMNSIVIGMLVTLYTSFTNISGHILFAAPQPTVLNLLKILKLDHIFEIVESVDAALARLASRRESASA